MIYFDVPSPLKINSNLHCSTMFNILCIFNVLLVIFSLDGINDWFRYALCVYIRRVLTLWSYNRVKWTSSMDIILCSRFFIKKYVIEGHNSSHSCGRINVIGVKKQFSYFKTNFLVIKCNIIMLVVRPLKSPKC